MSGKWHLGFREQHLPSSRGFHKSFAFLPGCGNSFGFEPVASPDWDQRPRVAGHLPLLYVREGAKWVPEPNLTNSPDGFYSSDYFADNLIDYLEGRSSEEKDMPFFAYLPFCAPHWPIQCLPTDRAKYKGRYDQGPDVLRENRLKRLIGLGLVKADVKAHEVFSKTKEWEDLTPEERKLSARAMECYAGMVHAMDRAIGRVIDHLDKQGVLDNTVVMFMSDNGAEGAALEALPVMGPRLLEVIDKYYDNSYENLGNHDSFIWIGPRWAQASTAPNRLMKGFITEGGIRVPFLVRYPGFKAYEPGSICGSFTTCMDLVPTLLSLAGATHPNPSPSPPRHKKPYRDREVFGLRGKSWLPYLEEDGPKAGEDDSLAIHGTSDPPIGWEMHNRASIRHGNWKIVCIPEGQPTGTGKWQLYDLSVDQGETNDVAALYPDKLVELVTLWDEYVAETGTVFGPSILPSQGSRQLLPNQIGGDPIDDQKIWMTLGRGAKFRDSERGAAKTAL